VESKSEHNLLEIREYLSQNQLRSFYFKNLHEIKKIETIFKEKQTKSKYFKITSNGFRFREMGLAKQ